MSRPRVQVFRREPFDAKEIVKDALRARFDLTDDEAAEAIDNLDVIPKVSPHLRRRVVTDAETDRR